MRRGEKRDARCGMRDARPWVRAVAKLGQVMSRQAEAPASGPVPRPPSPVPPGPVPRAAAGLLLATALLLLVPALRGRADGSLADDVAVVCREEWGSWEEPVKARARLADAGAPAARLLAKAWAENDAPHARDWVAATLRLMVDRFHANKESAASPREALVEMLATPADPLPLRVVAAECLGRLGDARTAPALIAALRNEDVAAPAAAALGALRARESVAALLEACRSGDPEVRLAALRALGQIGDKAAVPALAEAAGAAKGEEPITAAEALGEIGDASAGEALRKLVEAGNPEVRRRAALALMRRDTRLAASGNLKALLGEPGGGCQGCHAQVAADFAASKHAKQAAMKCGSCHGASVKHMEEYGKVKPDSPLSRPEMPAACGKCHKEFSDPREVRYDPVTGLDHRFLWSMPALVREAMKLLRGDILPADLPELLRDDFEGPGLSRWQLAAPNLWQIGTVEGGHALELLNGRRHPTIGAPGAFALAKDLTVGTFSLTARVCCTAPTTNALRDLCVVFGYQDPEHFYFAHFAASTGNGVNMIAIVNGKDRLPIHLEANPPARLKDTAFHAVKVERNARTGAIKAYIDDMKRPILTARDTTFPAGAIGFSSLGDKGCFDDVVLRGERATPMAAIAPAPAAQAAAPVAEAGQGKPSAPIVVDEALLTAVPPPLKVVYRGSFENGKAEGWLPREGNRWEVLKDAAPGVGFFYRLAEVGKQGKLRAPGGYAILDRHVVSDCVLTARVRCLQKAGFRGRDMALLFGYRDPQHYYYIHFSNYSNAIHNAILKVDGRDRAPIPLLAPAAARLDDCEWHTLRVWRESSTGLIRAYVDDLARPVLMARDATFREGKVGIGSFDDWGDFDNVELAVPR